MSFAAIAPPTPRPVGAASTSATRRRRPAAAPALHRCVRPRAAPPSNWRASGARRAPPAAWMNDPSPAPDAPALAAARARRRSARARARRCRARVGGAGALANIASRGVAVHEGALRRTSSRSASRPRRTLLGVAQRWRTLWTRRAGEPRKGQKKPPRPAACSRCEGDCTRRGEADGDAHHPLLRHSGEEEAGAAARIVRRTQYAARRMHLLNPLTGARATRAAERRRDSPLLERAPRSSSARAEPAARPTARATRAVPPPAGAAASPLRRSAPSRRAGRRASLVLSDPLGESRARTPARDARSLRHERGAPASRRYRRSGSAVRAAAMVPPRPAAS